MLRLWKDGVKLHMYTWYWCMEHGNQTEYKREREEFAVTVDNACIFNNLTFSDISPTGFLANCIEDKEHFASVVLSKAN